MEEMVYPTVGILVKNRRLQTIFVFTAGLGVLMLLAGATRTHRMAKKTGKKTASGVSKQVSKVLPKSMGKKA